MAEVTYNPVLPLDYLIIKELPDEGTTVANLYPVGTSVAELKKKIPLTSDQLSSRIRVLHLCELVVKARTIGSNHSVYQITPKGKGLLREWAEKYEPKVTTPTQETTHGESEGASGEVRSDGGHDRPPTG